MNVTSILIVLGIAVGAYFLSQYAFGAGNRQEDRRRAAAELAAKLKSLGLVQIPDLLLDYSVGDYGGMAAHIMQVSKLFLGGEEAVLQEFAKVFERLLDAKLATEEGRAIIKAKLDAATTAANDPTKP